MNATERQTWATHPDIGELRRFIGDTFQQDEHRRAMLAAVVTVGVHADRHPNRVLTEYVRARDTDRARLAQALHREEIGQ